MRLIDANEFWNRLSNVVYDIFTVHEKDGQLTNTASVGYYTQTIQEVLKQTKTVDAVPVVHGIWLVDDYDSGDPGYYSAFIEVHCSKCGYGLGAESGQYGWYYGDPFPLNYCPNCGAKMDGDGDGT